MTLSLSLSNVVFTFPNLQLATFKTSKWNVCLWYSIVSKKPNKNITDISIGDNQLKS